MALQPGLHSPSSYLAPSQSKLSVLGAVLFFSPQISRGKTKQTAFLKILQNCAAFTTDSDAFPYWNNKHTGNIRDMGGRKSPSISEIERQQSEKQLMRFSPAVSPRGLEERGLICCMPFLLTSKACRGTEGSCLHLAVGIKRLFEHLVINWSFLAISDSR